MKRTHGEACILDFWHFASQCGYDDVRSLATGFVIVDERFRTMPVQVNHEIALDTTMYPPVRFATCLFKLEGAITRKLDLERNVNGNIGLYEPSNE